jgi:hypothetical protein
MSDQISLEFRYRPSRVTAIGLFLLVCLGACLLVWAGLFADMPPARILGIQVLNARQAKVLYLIVASLSPFAVVLMFFFMICSVCGKNRVTFDVDSVTLPKPNWLGIPNRSITLPFNEIVSVERRRFIGNALMLRIIHRSGRIDLFSNMFSKRQDFETVAEILLALSHSEPSEPPADSSD